jgi:Fe-S oxidoreductase
MPLERHIPAFAPSTFQAWFRTRRTPANRSGQPVILWPDTFNNHFHPRTAIAAVRALESAGYDVRVPVGPVCCGRPLYDYGMLDTAKRWLRQTLDTLAPDIEAGVPVVGLEPSCVAVFRDEIRELLPDHENGKRLARQTFLLSEFLNQAGFQYPQLHRKAVVHGHCHHKAIMKFDAEQQALRSIGLDANILDAGCCGMAGSFGFEREHYDISMRVGERALLPAVRMAPADALIVADGFSCRTQIAGATNRRALHLADVIEMAGREGVDGPPGDYPERGYVPDYAADRRIGPATAAVVGSAVGIAAAAALLRLRR